MSISVEGYGVQPPSPGRQQLQTESRQERWMYEFEHALLQEAGKKPRTAPDRAHHQDGATDAQPGRAQQAGDNPLAGTAGAAAFAFRSTHDVDLNNTHGRVDPMIDGHIKNGAGSSSASPNKRQAIGREMASAASGASGTAESSFSRDTTLSSGNGAVASDASTTRAGLFAGHEASPGGESEPHLTPMAGAQVDTFIANKALEPSSPTSGASAGASLAQGLMSAGPQEGMALAPTTADSNAKTLAATGFGWNAEAVPNGEPAPEEAAKDAGQPRAPVAQAKPETEEYAARLLHVYRSADGVQAWIRDAAIGQTQARAVAQAMAGELAASGAVLTALTVNGRPQTLPLTASSADSRDEFLDDERGADTLAHLFKSYDMTKNGAA